MSATLQSVKMGVGSLHDVSEDVVEANDLPWAGGAGSEVGRGAIGNALRFVLEQSEFVVCQCRRVLQQVLKR